MILHKTNYLKAILLRTLVGFCCLVFILCFKLVNQLFREWINIAREHFVILLHNQPPPPTRLFRFSCSAGDFFLPYGSGFDAYTSSSPTCGDLFCAACTLSFGGGLGDLFCAACSLSCGSGFGDLFCTACSLSCGSGLGDLFCAACSLSCGSGLGDLFCAACSLSCSGALGDLFCAACSVSFGGTSANGSILNSNVSSSSTILHHRELDSSNSLLPNALLFCNPFSAMCCLGETHLSWRIPCAL